MPFPTPLLLFALPIIELTGLIYVGQEYGALNVILWVVFSIFFGVNIIRMAGWVTAQKLQDSMRRGDVPIATMFQAAGMVFAGLFLIIPGFLTDIIGLLLLIGPIRTLIGKVIASRTVFHTSAGMAGMGSSEYKEYKQHDDIIIDGDFEIINEEDKDASHEEKPISQIDYEKTD